MRRCSAASPAASNRPGHDQRGQCPRVSPPSNLQRRPANPLPRRHKRMRAPVPRSSQHASTRDALVRRIGRASRTFSTTLIPCISGRSPFRASVSAGLVSGATTSDSRQLQAEHFSRRDSPPTVSMLVPMRANLTASVGRGAETCLVASPGRGIIARPRRIRPPISPRRSVTRSGVTRPGIARRDDPAWRRVIGLAVLHRHDQSIGRCHATWTRWRRLARGYRRGTAQQTEPQQHSEHQSTHVIGLLVEAKRCAARAATRHPTLFR